VFALKEKERGKWLEKKTSAQVQFMRAVVTWRGLLIYKPSK
jgi:hypothetical protein